MLKKVLAVIAIIIVGCFTACVGVDPDGRGYARHGWLSGLSGAQGESRHRAYSGHFRHQS